MGAASIEEATKRCSKCHDVKPLDDFHKNKAHSDGRANYCKECTKKNCKKQYHSGKPRYSNDTSRVRHNTETAQYKKNNPIKARAQDTVKRAVQSGKLPKVQTLQCTHCGRMATSYHHWSYEREHWLDVVPLCHSCHMKIHFPVA